MSNIVTSHQDKLYLHRERLQRKYQLVMDVIIKRFILLLIILLYEMLNKGKEQELFYTFC